MRGLRNGSVPRCGCDIAPFVYIDPDDDNNGTLEIRSRVGKAFGMPYIYHKTRGARFGTSDLSRSLSAQADLIGIPVISAETGESRRVSAQFVALGVKGVHNEMRTMGMLDGEPPPPSSSARSASSPSLTPAVAAAFEPCAWGPSLRALKSRGSPSKMHGPNRRR